jgi:probable HAF family extracellular repeat protein
MRLHPVHGLSLLAVAVTIPALGQPTFQGVGFLNPNVPGSLANKISKNGSVVVGETIVHHDVPLVDQYRAFRWTAEEGMTELSVIPGGNAESVAYGVSADGSVIVGQSDDGCCAEGGTAFRWTAATGMVSMGSLGGPTNYGYAFQTSDDGSIVMGSMDDGSSGPFGGVGFQAFRWTAATGMQAFGQAPNGVKLEAASINGNGSVAWASHGDLSTYKWTAATGWVLQPPAFNLITWIRDDGEVVFTSRCTGSAASCPRAYRWTASGGFQDLGSVPGSSDRGDTAVRGISEDGSVAVGFANFDPNDGGIGFIWDTQHGMRVLQQVLLSDFQLTDAAGWSNLEPTGLSGDGKVICGTGFDPEGNQQGWVANLRGAIVICHADFDGSGGLSTQDIFDLLNAWFAGDVRADFNGVDGLTVQDIFDFLNAWFAGC